MSKSIRRICSFISLSVIFITITFIWIGAKYWFEGTVIHTWVDYCITGILSVYITRELMRSLCTEARKTRRTSR